MKEVAEERGKDNYQIRQIEELTVKFKRKMEERNCRWCCKEKEMIEHILKHFGEGENEYFLLQVMCVYFKTLW